MDENKFIILSIIKRVFGEPKNSSDPQNKKQWEFNCRSTTCSNDHNKFNLAFNSEHNIYKCWKCGESGILHKLIKKYGNKKDYEDLLLVLPVFNNNISNVFRRPIVNHNLITCPLPEGFTHLLKENNSKLRNLALNYIIRKRKVTEDQINFYNIGYTEIGAYRNRVIIPSYNTNNNVNYFEARAFLENTKLAYYKPDKKAFPQNNVPEKYDIIFNEKNINWDLPIYLVEGVFDMFRIPNSIPMLGKKLSWLLISKLLEKKAKIIICLDEDAFKDVFEIYETLSSLDIDVYIMDLSGHGDISEVYEKNGQGGIIQLMGNVKKVNLTFQMKKFLKM